MSAPWLDLPHVTAELLGTGGVLRQSDDDFLVDETLAYAPSGQGEHVFVRIEKRGLSTPQAAEMLARALELPAQDIGWAGMKDKYAVTRQTLSLPAPATPERALALELPELRVLEAVRHEHKLRTGHVASNRFTVRVCATQVAEELAAERARAVLDALARAPGSPNWFAEQRFGRHGDNAEIGRALILDTPLPRGMRRPRGRAMRLYISALQSQLFNEYLSARMHDGAFRQVLAGDILQKRASGGMFVCAEPDVDQPRLEAGEVVPTGPMFGHKVRLPPGDTAAGAREARVLERHGLALESFARVKKLGVGTRRAIAVSLGEYAVAPVAERTIEISFHLPAGAYATAVLREVVKAPDPATRESDAP